MEFVKFFYRMTEWRLEATSGGSLVWHPSWSWDAENKWLDSLEQLLTFSTRDLPPLCFRTCPLLWVVISLDTLGTFTVWRNAIFWTDIPHSPDTFSHRQAVQRRIGSVSYWSFVLEKRFRGAETFWRWVFFFFNFSNKRKAFCNKDKLYGESARTSFILKATNVHYLF